MTEYFTVGNRRLKKLTSTGIQRMRAQGFEVRELTPPKILTGSYDSNLEEVLESQIFPRNANALLKGEENIYLEFSAGSSFSIRKRQYPVIFYEIK